MFRLTSPTAVVCTSVLFSAKHQIARGQKLLPGYSITSLQARLLSAGWSYFNTPTLLKAGSSHVICRLKSKRQFALPMLWSIEFLHSAQALLFLQQYKAVLARAHLSPLHLANCRRWQSISSLGMKACQASGLAFSIITKALPSSPPTALPSPTFHLSVCTTAIQLLKPTQCILGVWFLLALPPTSKSQVINTSCHND